MELVVLSGKGGTGKTTIATALSELINDVTRVDCDVDAPNFHLFYKGKNIEESSFIGGKKAEINKDLCKQCNKCELVCKFSAIKNYKIDPFLCEGCGACKLVCPYEAIKLKDAKTADVFLSKVAKGVISRAEMEIGSDGSGKLISQLRRNASSANDNNSFTIIDGSPGIGCPVISSITGSDAVLVVTEPTKSGIKDLTRVVDLCNHFGIFTMACINKYDINEDMSKEIDEYLRSKNIDLVGKIPYDNMVVKSINELKPITKYDNSLAKKAIEDMLNNIKKIIKI
ncbi:MAG: ATP-binding protein [Terrisporobacter othiniensis]|uniref:(4Fe-4S)-binding protein n=1 Tax=Terrisporobacter othiniensis TaxID=1577792 RepID=A0A0B3VYG5_9FIRM|nr:ATP-binding protein [Terrisporobacter othiniensis]KHS57754.1 (4Fe-4S)-binding protein [Terrisporobacter othiniensis]MDY3373250.1 ATP-binding protein [Terrisporobacter othiniensis]